MNFRNVKTKESLRQETGTSQALFQSLFYWSFPLYFLYFALPIYSKTLGASALEIGGLFAVFTGTTIVLRPLVGWAIDRYGRKHFLVIALTLYSMAMAVFAFANSLPELYLARLTQGLGSSFLWITVNTMITDVTEPQKRGGVLGHVSAITARGGLVGIFAGFLLITWLPEEYSWQVTFLAYTLATVLGVWLAWKYVPETKPTKRILSLPERPVVYDRALKLMLPVFVTGVSEAMVGPIYLIYLQDKFTISIVTLAWAFLPAGLIPALMARRLGSLSDQFGRIRVMTFGLIGSGIFSLLLPGVSSLAWLAILYTISAITWGASEPAEAALVADFSPEEGRGVAYSIYDLVGSLGATIGPLIGGAIYDVVGQASPFYMNGILLILNAVWIFLAFDK